MSVKEFYGTDPKECLSSFCPVNAHLDGFDVAAFIGSDPTQVFASAFYFAGERVRLLSERYRVGRLKCVEETFGRFIQDGRQIAIGYGDGLRNQPRVMFTVAYLNFGSVFAFFVRSGRRKLVTYDRSKDSYVCGPPQPFSVPDPSTKRLIKTSVGAASFASRVLIDQVRLTNQLHYRKNTHPLFPITPDAPIELCVAYLDEDAKTSHNDNGIVEVALKDQSSVGMGRWFASKCLKRRVEAV